MNIGAPIRTVYIEPIEEPPPAETPAPPERVPGPLPYPGAELQPVR
jgi:hypothetical protein